MKVDVNSELTKNKQLSFEENFWTGKRTVSYDGQLLQKKNRNTFIYSGEGESQEFTVKGNQTIGVTISMFGNTVEIARKLLWYEIVLAALTFLIALVVITIGSAKGTMEVWEGFVNGAICGGFGGGLAFTSIAFVRKIDKVWLKLLFMVELLLVSFLVSYLFTFIIFKA